MVFLFKHNLVLSLSYYLTLNKYTHKCNSNYNIDIKYINKYYFIFKLTSNYILIILPTYLFLIRIVVFVINPYHIRRLINREMAAGSIAVPTIIPLRNPIAGQHKNAIDNETLIELRSG